VAEQCCLIDGFGPIPIVRPETVTALSELVRQAAAGGTAVYPVGGQTTLNLGAPPNAPGRAVDMRGLAQVIDFPARDMTITVQAGITIGLLGTILAKEKLRLPLDVPRAEQATLGGVLAANVSGSRRYGFRTVRDYVIGISAINDAGNDYKAGGRVVKNVAGYDLCKLLIGSLGTLGIITQVTLKLRPLPEEQALVSLACASPALETTLAQLHVSRTSPVCLDLLNSATAQEVFDQAKMSVPQGQWVLIVGFEGNAEAVQWQVQQLVREHCGAGADHGSLEARIGFTAEPLWQSLAEWHLWPGSSVTFKADLRPSALASFCQEVAGLGGTPWLRAHAGNGIVWGHLRGDVTKEQAANVLSSWRELARAGQGRVVVARCPSAWKHTLSVWGPSPPDAWLMREVKNKFDPRRLFNPGRFVDGI
jgi:glycolate oxidase FAD binding subunit